MKKTGRILASLGAILFLIVLVNYIFHTLGGTENTAGNFELTDGWNVSVNGTWYEDVDLNELSFPLTKRGDIVTMEHTLPEGMVDGSVMQFYVTHAAVKVWVEDELIYEYGQELYEQDRMLGYGYHFVQIPSDTSGQLMRIRLCVSERNAFANLDVPILEEGTHLMRNFLIERRVAVAVIFFLVVFGVVFIFATIFFSFEGADFYRLMNLAFFSLCVGIWCLCNYDIIMIFTYNIRAKAIMEFSAIYGAPMSLFGYFHEEATKKCGKLQRYCYYAILGLQFIFMISTLFLQKLGVVHFPDMLMFNQALMVLMIIYLVVMSAGNAWKRQKNQYVLMAGMTVMVAMAAVDLVRYNMQMYFSGFDGGHFISYTYLGIFVFVLALIVDFMQRTSANLYSTARNETLEKMAYTDALTGLLNRRRCEEIYDEIDKNKSDYAVVALDLNNLKKVNDSLGHDAGDLYICEFGSVLTKAFSDCGEVIRSGGDEFLVVIREASKVDIQAKIDAMNQLIADLNQRHANWNMSTAYGVCFANEDATRTIREADKVADARMYEKKREMKGKRK